MLVSSLGGEESRSEGLQADLRANQGGGSGEEEAEGVEHHLAELM